MFSGLQIQRYQKSLRSDYGNKRIIIAGVGGQGILLASDLLSDAAMRAGFDVKNLRSME